MKMNWKLLDIRYGRANRGQYIVALVIVTIFPYIFSFVLGEIEILGEIKVQHDSIIAHALSFFGLALSMLISYTTMLIVARRLRDINQSGWLIMIFIIPMAISRYYNHLSVTSVQDVTTIVMIIFVGWVIAYFTMFLSLLIVPGSSGINKYGYHPTEFNFKNMVSSGNREEWLHKQKRNEIHKVDQLQIYNDKKAEKQRNKARLEERERLKDIDIF